MKSRIAADLLSDIIIERDDFRLLLCKLQRTVAELFLTNQSSFIIDTNEVNHLLRYADILSHSSEPKYRELSYIIVTLLRECDSNNIFDKTLHSRLFTVTEAILVQLGNFPGIQTLKKSGEESQYMLPASRELVRISKELIQQTKKGKVFTDAQYSIMEKMLDEDFFSFSGPTSLGKSFIIKNKLYDIVHPGSTNDYCIVVIVPTKALISQTAKDLRQLLSDIPHINVATYPSLPKYLQKKFKQTIFVFTPERLLRYLADPVRDINYLIIDEAQKIIAEDDARSSLYYHAIIEAIRRFATKLIFASPSLDNPEIFLKLFGKATNGSMATRERAVAQQRYFIDLVEQKQYYTSGVEQILQELDAPPAQNNIIDVILSRSCGKKTIIYINGSLKSAEFAVQLSARRKQVRNKKVDSLIDEVGDYIHKDYYLTDALRHGVAFHHGKMPQEVREKVEQIFSDPDSAVQFVICTSTLLEGVNLPAKNIFVINDRHGAKHFSQIDFENLAGRAGRLTYDFSGNIICIRSEKGQWKDKTRELISRPKYIHGESFLINPDRRRKKEYTDIARTLKDEPLPAKASESRRRIAEHYASILILHAIDNQQTLLRSYFLEKIPDAHNLLIKKTTSIGIPSDALRRSPGIFPRYQEKIWKYLHSGSFSPLVSENLDFDSLFEALKILSDLYEWRDTEVSGQDPLMPRRPSQGGWERRLKYWAMLMYRWVQGYPLNQIIANSIAYYDRIKVIKYRDYSQSGYLIKEAFDRNNSKHINIIIDRTLKDIENGLRFRIVGYLQNFYDLSALALGVDASGINLATLVEYGTTDQRSIELQEIGFSRDVATELLESCEDLIGFSESNELEWLNESEILSVSTLSDKARTEIKSLVKGDIEG